MHLKDGDGPSGPSLTDRKRFGAVNPTIWGVRLDKFVTCVKRRLGFVTQRARQPGRSEPSDGGRARVSPTPGFPAGLYPISTSGRMGFCARRSHDHDGGQCLQTAGLVSCCSQAAYRALAEDKRLADVADCSGES